MGGVFEKFQKAEKKKMLRLGARVMKMLASGRTIKEVSQVTGLAEDVIEDVYSVCSRIGGQEEDIRR